MNEMNKKRTPVRGLMVALGITAILTAVVAGTQNAQRSAPAAREQASKGKAKTEATIWQPTMDAAIKEAKRSGKPILVDFMATWCPPCQMMEEQTYPDAALIRESRQWVMVKVDVDKYPDVAAKYGASSLPTIGFLRPDGRPIKGVAGFHDAPQIIEEMKAAQVEMGALKSQTP